MAHQDTDAISFGYYALPSPKRVWDMKGPSPGLGNDQWTPIETPLTAGDIAFRQHNGGRTPAPNPPIFLPFAQRYIHVR